MTVDNATDTRFWFLAVVATWRVALWIYYLLWFCKLGGSTFVVAMLPLCLVVTLLTMLNLDRVVFEFMGGSNHVSTDDAAFLALNLLAVLSVLAFVPLLLFYIVIVYRRRTQKLPEAQTTLEQKS